MRFHFLKTMYTLSSRYTFYPLKVRHPFFIAGFFSNHMLFFVVLNCFL
jgi:hypothetical protein